MAINDIEIVLENPENKTKVKFKIESNAPVERRITIAAKPGIKLSEKRLNIYKEKLKILGTQEVTRVPIDSPVIESLEQHENSCYVKLTRYSCPLLIPLTCITLEISTIDFARGNEGIVVTEKRYATDNDLCDVEFSTTALEAGTVYYVRLRYHAGGGFSNWSDTRSFMVQRPTLPKPVLNPTVDYQYKETIPFDVAITVTTEGLEESNHDSSTWRIYERRGQQLVEVWSKVKSATDLRSITLTSLFPTILKYNKNYYITVTIYASNRGNAFSYESDPILINAKDVEIRPPANLSVFPAVVTVANPILGFDDQIFVNINGKEKLLEWSNIDKVYWEVTSPSSTIKHMNNSSTINLPASSLLPNTTYTVKAWYYHKYLGESEPAVLEFTTGREFASFRDELYYPLKTSDGLGYYGDIPTNKLMNENVNYAGVFINNRSYDIGEEVTHEGKLYICKRKTPSVGFTMSEYFVESTSSDAAFIYKSGLPTYRWLVNKVGLNPYLCTNDVLSGNTNLLHNDVSGWLKCQNKLGKIIYISKMPLYSGVSVNDLIKADIYHPRRKTIRIADALYYVRLLCTKVNIGYDAMDPAYRNNNLNFDYGSEVIDYEEDNIITCLINGKLASFTSTDLDVSTTENKEILYSSQQLNSYKIDTQAGMTFLPVTFNAPDDRRYVIRLVLEYIKESDKPIYHVSPRIPGPNPVVKEDGSIEGYNPHLDYCYLGQVPVHEFLTSVAISERSGLHADTPTPNRLWHKFYYQGLIYFLSQGLNISQIKISELEKKNIIQPTPLFVTQDGFDKPTHGKIIFNGVIFNVCCPKALNADSQHIIIKNARGLPHNILEPGTANQDITVAYDSFLSDCVYGIYTTQTATAEDPRQIPFSGAKGYKGRYKSTDKSVPRIIDNLGSCEKTDYEATFLTSQQFVRTDGTNNYVLNGQRDIYIMKEHNGKDPVDVLFCLTVNPTIDSKKLWKK